VFVDSADNRLTYIPAGSGTNKVKFQESVATTLTPIVAFTLTAAQSGIEVFLGPTAGFAITLPAAAAGLKYRFTVRDNFATWFVHGHAQTSGAITFTTAG
jgi:biotin transporter BioY